MGILFRASEVMAEQRRRNLAVIGLLPNTAASLVHCTRWAAQLPAPQCRSRSLKALYTRDDRHCSCAMTLGASQERHARPSTACTQPPPPSHPRTRRLSASTTRPRLAGRPVPGPRRSPASRHAQRHCHATKMITRRTASLVTAHNFADHDPGHGP